MKRAPKILLGLLIVLVVVVIVGIYLIWQALDKETTELSQRTGDLGFMSDREGVWDLFLIDPDGNTSNATASYDNHSYFFNFTFSGEVINYYAADGDGSNPAIVNVDGSDLKVLNYATALMETLQSGNVDMDPAWSPDSTQIAWTKIAGMPPAVRLYVGNTDFSDEEELSGEGFTNNMIAWSPDGSKIVFTSDRSGSNNVYVARVASGAVQKLTDEGYDVQPVWSLDGTQIMFISERDTNLSTGQFDFYVMNADGSDQRLLGADEVFTGDPTYSPDGTQVAYMSNESGFWHIYVMDADGSNVRQVTEGETNNIFPAWRPIPADNVEDEGEDAAE